MLVEGELLFIHSSTIYAKQCCRLIMRAVNYSVMQLEQLNGV